MSQISDFIGELKHVDFFHSRIRICFRSFVFSNILCLDRIKGWCVFPLSRIFCFGWKMCFYDLATHRQVYRVTTTLHMGIGWGNPITLSMCSWDDEVCMAGVLLLMDASRVVIWRRIIQQLQLKQLFGPLKTEELFFFVNFHLLKPTWNPKWPVLNGWKWWLPLIETK